MSNPPTAARGRSPTSAIVGTAVFVALVPGTVVLVVPWWIRSAAGGAAGASPGAWLRIAGALLCAGGLAIFADFVTRFVAEGHGTPAPVAPTRFLVRGGSYRFTRNPGYVGVVSMIAGQALWFGSPATLVYAAVLAVGFHVFVLLYEEPTLRATYGADYEAYCRQVPRWLPRPSALLRRGA
ncbi:MAG TPA: isoprenylcysteine carboxylmethyltransferase family protein [Candidatus Binatia bacterium]|nr:isoprenylcysteine carboxylmethyltransferase family protein [Candidatus Binatia bacterium]